MPNARANHAINTITVATVSPGNTTAATASTRLRTPPIMLHADGAPITFCARASMNSAKAANSIHSETEMTM